MSACIAVLLLAIIAAQAMRSWRVWHGEISRAAIPASADYYLAYSNGGTEDYDLYFDLHGSVDALKRADVLFLGNSRMQHAFKDRQVLHDFFSKRSLNYYNLAFGYGEGDTLPEAIIRKYDLHPKWVVINADPYFGALTSPLAAAVLRGSAFDARKFDFETNVSFYVRRELHRVVPRLALSAFNDETSWIYYRSKDDGTILLSACTGRPSPVPDQPADPVDPSPKILAAAKQFMQEMKARGGRIVLTWVPVGESFSSRPVRVPGLPFITPQLAGMNTIDGSHLDDESGRRFSSAFLQQFAKLLDDHDPGR